MTNSTFYKTFLDEDWSFVRGPARLMYADESIDFPTQLNDMIIIQNSVTGDFIPNNILSQPYDAQPHWNDIGATKGGVSIEVNPQGQTYAIDPNTGYMYADQNSWEVTITTSVADATLETLEVVWDTTGSLEYTNALSETERRMNYGPVPRSTVRRLAILYLNQDDGVDKIRAIAFRRVQLSPIQSSMNFNKAGDQQSFSVKFSAFADTTVATPQGKFFSIFESV